MNSSETTSQKKIKQQVALERVVGFAQRFGEDHLLLACHAAFPLALTPDLLYHIWAQFVWQAPWTAVADVLLSRLCSEVGYELYEMDVETRNLLLEELQEDEHFGQPRLMELGDFLLDYMAQQVKRHDPHLRDLAEVQHWTALAYTRPDQAAHELTAALSNLIGGYEEHGENDQDADLIRVASIVEALEKPLAGFAPLMIYARGMAHWIRDHKEEAETEFNKLRGQEQLAGAILRIPTGKSQVQAFTAMPEPEIFISYAGRDESLTIVNALDAFLQVQGMTVVRDNRDIGYKGLIKGYMQQLGKGKFVIIVLSDQYFKSKSCMFELKLLSRQQDFYDRIFPVIIENTSIYEAEDLLYYARYWDKKIEHLQQEIKNTPNISNLQGITDDLNLYVDIRNNIAKLMDFLRNINTHPLKGSNFEPLLKAIRTQIEQDQAMPMSTREVKTEVKEVKTRQMPVTLRRQIIDFFMSLPNIHDPNTPRALILSAGLDSQLLSQISFNGPPGQFFQLLLPPLMQYGQLQDGRHALQAVLEAARNFVGEDGKTMCDNLLREFGWASSAYQTPPVRVFISYAREDRTMAQRLYNDLKQAGVKPWLDVEDLRPGQRWKDMINQAIRNSSYIITLLSSHSISKRGFVQKELKKALDMVEELPPEDVLLIPVRLDACEPQNELLRELHWVDLFPSYEDGLARILGVLTTASPNLTKSKEETPLLSSADFDVFLCHNSVDKAAVKEIAKRLKKEGIRPWLDEWELRPGLIWQDELEKQIEHIQSVAVFVGQSGLGPWQDMELSTFLRQFAKRQCPIIPVILPDCEEAPKLPLFLEGMMWVDFRQKVPDPFRQLIWGITGKKPSMQGIFSSGKNTRMLLPPVLYNRCRSVLMRCSEFDSNASLHAVFITTELYPFQVRLPEAANKSERIDKCLAFLLPLRLQDGRAVLPLFLETLSVRYSPDDHLHAELESLRTEILNLKQSDEEIQRDVESISTDFILRLQQDLILRQEFRDITQELEEEIDVLYFDFIGLRETSSTIDLIALVDADTFSETDIANFCDRFFVVVKSSRKMFHLKKVPNPCGLLCFVFGNGCSYKLMKFTEKQSRISHAVSDSGIVVPWVIDIKNNHIQPHKNPVSKFPPVIVLSDASGILSGLRVHPGLKYLKGFLTSYKY